MIRATQTNMINGATCTRDELIVAMREVGRQWQHGAWAMMSSLFQEIARVRGFSEITTPELNPGKTLWFGVKVNASGEKVSAWIRQIRAEQQAHTSDPFAIHVIGWVECGDVRRFIAYAWYGELPGDAAQRINKAARESGILQPVM